MATTMERLEEVVSELKGRPFSFGVEPLNNGWELWDVFPAVAEMDAFDPTDHGEGRDFLAWTEHTASHAFDAAGELVRPIVLWWGGPRAELQTALTRAGLIARFEVSEEPREPYAESGALVLSPQGQDGKSDLSLLLAAFDTLGARDVVALAVAGFTQSDGWSDVASEVSARGLGDDYTSVFWTAQDHQVFDEIGNLTGQLWLTCRGAIDTIAVAITQVGLVVERLSDPGLEHVLVVTSATPHELEIPSVADVLAREPASTAASATRVLLQDERSPLGANVGLKAPGSLPIVRIAWNKDASRLAIATEFTDQGGFPSAPVYWIAIDDEGLELTAANFGADHATANGVRWLADGRLLVAAREYRREPDEPVRQTFVVLYEIAPGEAAREILARRNSHIGSGELMSVDAAERWLVLSEPSGVSLYAVPALGEPWSPEGKRFAIEGEPEHAYTFASLAPDGDRIIWTDGHKAPLVCLTRDGTEAWRVNPTAGVGLGVWWVGFSPDGRTLAIASSQRHTQSGTLRLHAVCDGTVQTTVSRATGGERFRSFAFHPEGQFLVAGLDDGVVRVFDLQQERFVDTRVFRYGAVTQLAFSPSGDKLAVGGGKGDLAIFAWRGLAPLGRPADGAAEKCESPSLLELVALIASTPKGASKARLLQSASERLMELTRELFGQTRELEVQFDDASGEIGLYVYMTVVLEPTDRTREISLEAVQAHGLDANLGEELGFQIFWHPKDAQMAAFQDDTFGELLSLESRRLALEVARAR